MEGASNDQGKPVCTVAPVPALNQFLLCFQILILKGLQLILSDRSPERFKFQELGDMGSFPLLDELFTIFDQICQSFNFFRFRWQDFSHPGKGEPPVQHF